MEIKRIGISAAAPGMLVAENVFNTANQLIVPKDAILTDKAIARMRFHSVMSLRIYEGDEVPAPIIEPKSVERSYFDKLRETEEFTAYNKNFKSSVSTFENQLKEFVKSGSNDNRSLIDSVQSLKGSCRNGIQVFDLLHCMRNYDDLTFAHSLNVALICAVEGTWLGMSDADIELLIQCGIYHDIGKLLIPKEILEKKEDLTPEERKLLNSHVMQGYNLIRDKALDTRVKLCTMMHHERCDGSGYPLKMKAEQIDDFAKILAIADVYEAMTSPRPYRPAKCPFEVIRMFESDGLKLFDPKFLMTFIENIVNSYIGTKVRLNTGDIGTIIYINKLSYSRPIIQIDEEKYIDLSKVTGAYIVAML